MLKKSLGLKFEVTPSQLFCTAQSLNFYKEVFSDYAYEQEISWNELLQQTNENLIETRTALFR